MPENEYLVPVRISARKMFWVKAKSEEEAMAKADDIAAEYDFGDIEDIEYTVKQPVDTRACR